jgi:hypothetical protein
MNVLSLVGGAVAAPAAVCGVFFVMVLIGFRDRHRQSRARIEPSPQSEAVRT